MKELTLENVTNRLTRYGVELPAPETQLKRYRGIGNKAILLLRQAGLTTEPYLKEKKKIPIHLSGRLKLAYERLKAAKQEVKLAKYAVFQWKMQQRNSENPH